MRSTDHEPGHGDGAHDPSAELGAQSVAAAARAALVPPWRSADLRKPEARAERTGSAAGPPRQVRLRHQQVARSARAPRPPGRPA